MPDLVDTQSVRCLGCGADLGPDAVDERGVPTWAPHGTSCRSYYGAGRRVDYDRWLAAVARERSTMPERVRVVDVSTFDDGHELAGQTRVVVRWSGVDVSGHFAEHRDAVTLATNVAPV